MNLSEMLAAGETLQLALSLRFFTSVLLNSIPRSLPVPPSVSSALTVAGGSGIEDVGVGEEKEKGYSGRLDVWEQLFSHSCNKQTTSFPAEASWDSTAAATPNRENFMY